MAGFFQSLGRMVRGEPVFQQGDGTNKIQDQSNQSSTAKVIPQVTIRRIEFRPSGNDMELTIEANNESQADMMIDKVIMFERKHEIDTTLRPGERREFIVYRGPRPAQARDERAELWYRDPSGDYFASMHILECEHAGDGIIVKDVRFVPPVKDI